MGGPPVKRCYWGSSSFPPLIFFCSAWRTPHSFVPAITLSRSAGAQDPSMTGAVAPARQGLVIDRSSTALCLEPRGALGLDVARYSDLGVAFGRSCCEVHGACDVRINLYPAAPIRLAKVLHAWTIAQEDGAHLSNGRLASADLRCGLTATHPTCPTHPTGVSELSALSTLSREGRSLRNQTLLEIAPEGNGELARHCNNHDALNAPVLPFGPLHKPLRNRALGLMLDPQPG